MADLLPGELMTEILTRLPVKTLLQIRCVCRSWCCLISSPNFITSNLNRTIHFNEINSTHILLIGQYVKGRKGGCRFSVHLDDERLSRSSLQLESPIPNSAPHFRIFGSCNGLVCLTDNIFDCANSLVLWNPSIRKSLRLPMPAIALNSPVHRYYTRSDRNKVVRAGSHGPSRVVLGYGFDSKTNDYKVVIISEGPVPKVELYSLNRGCWRSISVVGPHHRIRCNPLAPQAFVNGVVHWVGHIMDAASDGSILTFDMISEVFSEMKLRAGWVATSLAVAVLGESLCMGHVDALDHQVSIWVMKEYGVVESWTKLFSFDMDIGLGHTLGFRRNDELLFLKGSHYLFSINLESQQVKDLGIRLSGVLDSIYVVTYMESLVLL